MSVEILPRRQAIRMLYTRGTHYEVGVDMGRTFASLIKEFLQLSTSLNKDYLPLYNTEQGKAVYNETLDCVKKSFPQYIRELEGIADGAQVEFYKLFLLHMDEILVQSVKNKKGARRSEPDGCSSIILNNAKQRFIGHNEDALGENINHWYFVVAHIINDSPQGKYNVKEERFMSLCYPGHLPGYTISYNHHGMVMCINTLCGKYLRSGHTPRHFISRALLSAETYSQALKIIKDKGCGAGDGCSFNLAFINSSSDKCYNIEMGPVVGDENESRVDIKEIPTGAHYVHTNKFEHMECQEDDEYVIASSCARMKTFSSYKEPTRKQDVLNMLSDCSGGEHCVYREDGQTNQKIKTLATGIFDLNAKTLTLYTDSPKLSEPHVTLPLILRERSCGCMDNK